MNTYDKTVAIISTVVKTFISLVVAFVVGLVVGFSGHNDELAALGVIVGIIVFWLICPGDTKNWIKNWTKPQITKDK